jgi:RNA polymerase sigma-70 factor (ECF subfamily)
MVTLSPELNPQFVRQRFGPLVRRWLRKGLGPDAEIEDAEQEVFLAIFCGLHRLRQPEALRLFVITVTRRTLARELRRRQRRDQLFASHDASSVNPIGDVADPAAHDAFYQFRSLLERLGERDRQAFVLRFAAGMETQQVAQVLGVSMPTAKRAFMRAWGRVTTWAVRDPVLCEYLELVPT